MLCVCVFLTDGGCYILWGGNLSCCWVHGVECIAFLHLRGDLLSVCTMWEGGRVGVRVVSCYMCELC